MKKKYIVLYISIILLILILIFNIYRIKNNKTPNIDEYVHVENTEFYEDKIFPKNMSKIEIGYDGKKDLVELYKGIYKIAKIYIPKFNSIETQEQLQTYYQKNSEQIIQDLGISKYEELEKLYEKVYMNKSSFEYISSEILVDTLKITSQKITFDLKIIFNENDEIIIDVDFPKNENEIIKFL